MPRKVLVIAYYFPPLGGIRASCTLQLVRHLPDYGWDPIVLTVENGSAFVYDDHSLMTLVPEVVPVYRTRSWEPLPATKAKGVADRLSSRRDVNSGGLRRWLVDGLKRLYFSLYIPDDKIGWYPFAIRQGRRIMREHDIDVIYAATPPHTNYLVAAALKRSSHKPLVLDYRDEWSTGKYRASTRLAWSTPLNRLMERKTLGSADGIVCVSEPIVRNLLHANLLSTKQAAVVVPNGFDPEDYRGVVARSRTPDKCTIVYTGSFYGERQTPAHFLRGLSRWLREQPQSRQHVQVLFVGSIYPAHRDLISELGLNDVVQVRGLVSHEEAIEYQLAADILLLIVGKGVGSQVVVTGKIFEYLGAGRPILALVPEGGAASHVIRSTRTGMVVDSDDVEAIAQALQDWYTAWINGGLLYEPDVESVAQYSWPMVTARMARLFETVSQEK